jgi:hypothetical protein
VDNIPRSKLYYIPDINKTDTLLIGYFHNAGDIVYYRKHQIEPEVFAEGLYGICEEYESDYLLYDFSLQEGDIYSYVCGYGGTTQRRVTSIEQVERGGFILKKIIFNDYDSSYWMEGMGSGQGFFEGKERIPTSEAFCIYICFSVNDEVLYMNPDYSECPIRTRGSNSIREIKSNSLMVFPNPMKSFATIQSDQPLKLIQLYDISGFLLYEQPCNNELQIVIQKQSLSSGMYFVKSILQNGSMQIKKLIIQ